MKLKSLGILIISQLVNLNFLSYSFSTSAKYNGYDESTFVMKLESFVVCISSNCLIITSFPLTKPALKNPPPVI